MARAFVSRRTSGLIALATGAVFGAVASSRAEIIVNTSLDHASFNPGQAMDVHVTATNPDDVPVTLLFDSNIQAQYLLDGIYMFPQAGFPDPSVRVIPANSSYTWTYRHDWYGYNLPLGSSSLVGRVRGYGDSPALNVPVVPPTLPTFSFVADFDTLPGTSAAVQSDSEYWPFGIHLRSENDDPVHRRP